MRRLAKDFKSWQVDYEKNNREHHLRLLPQPMFRYKSEDDESLDGAMFAFVRDGDLEVILTIDAAKKPDGTAQWVFDCDRVAVFEQYVSYRGKEVWSCPRSNSGNTRAGDNYFVRIVR